MSKIFVDWTLSTDCRPRWGRSCWLALTNGRVGIGFYGQETSASFPHEGTGPYMWRHVNEEPVWPDEVAAWAYLEPPDHPNAVAISLDDATDLEVDTVKGIDEDAMERLARLPDASIELGGIFTPPGQDLMAALEESLAKARAARRRREGEAEDA